MSRVEEDDDELLIITPPYRIGSSAPFRKLRRGLQKTTDAYIQHLANAGRTQYCRPYISPEWADFTVKEIADLNRQLDRMWFVCWLEEKPGEFGQTTR